MMRFAIEKSHNHETLERDKKRYPDLARERENLLGNTVNILKRILIRSRRGGLDRKSKILFLIIESSA